MVVIIRKNRSVKKIYTSEICSMKANPVADKTFAFSLKVMSLYKLLISEKEFVLSKQLLRSATSIGANVEEAIAAQSRKDFISKMSIALKGSSRTALLVKAD